MRGDSLRDLYAKTLALLGLALVGGLGALIDYWPVTHPLPRVATARLNPMPATAASHVDSAMAIAPAMAESLPAVRRRPITRVTPVSMSVRVAAASDLVGSSQPIGLAAPSPSLASFAVHPAPLLHASAITFVAPEQTPTPETMMTFAQHGSGQGSVEQGFLNDATDAAKRAGNTIMNGTMKTGASIVDGIRSVGGAVRRGLWRFVP